mgnify:CR=1 FL=1
MKIGLALGGGGARGLADLGILKALREMNIPIYCVAGTSIGAIIGGVFASGRLDPLLAWSAESNWRKLPELFLDPHLTSKSLISGDRIAKFLRRMIPPATFKDLSVPLAVVATDLQSGEEVVIREGALHSAIRASMSIPGIFSPVEREGRILVDGGMVDPLPVSICRQMGADCVIAVDLNVQRTSPNALDYNRLNILSVIDETFRVVMNIARKRRHPDDEPDLLLVPPVQDAKLLDFHKSARLVTAGYDYAWREEARLSRFRQI